MSTATEHIRADRLTTGRTVMVTTSTTMETITRVQVTGGYVDVETDRGSCYQWPAAHQVLALTSSGSR
ncbi:hypothetical protein ABZ135_38695 [Streptomyces sp. NPDC006339]|uniref:hypothetical protein n=1 Tax=Streptomyces sp. NPDC006339 TaxID=3156755 RepID=UPI0033BDDDF1